MLNQGKTDRNKKQNVGVDDAAHQRGQWYPQANAPLTKLPNRTGRNQEINANPGQSRQRQAGQEFTGKLPSQQCRLFPHDAPITWISIILLKPEIVAQGTL